MKKQLLVLLISCLFILQITPLQNKLKISNDFIDLFQQVKNDETFNSTAVREAIQYVDDKTMETRIKNNAYNAYMGEILNEYAKKLFYGKLSNGNPEIQKAFLFFKLAAKHGNAESLYYLSFYSFYNLDGRFLFKNSYDNLEDSDKHSQIVNFIKNMNSTTVMNAAQHSSVQGYDPAKFLLGNLYLKGRGVPANCAKAGSYFKELGNKLISEGLLTELDVSDITEKKRLDDLYFSLEPENSVLPLRDNIGEQQYLAMAADLGELPRIIELGYTYYYGLKGEKRDYQKAFEFFRKAAARGDLGAKVRVGKMLIKGLGVDKDINSGIKYLEEADKEGDPRAKNALGELYRSGEGVPMNQTVALNYFKEAARKDNFSAAIYNYGASLMSTDPTQIENGFQLVTLAAQQGHPLALYHTGLQYFHNPQLQNGCEMGAFLMKVGLERGPWSDKLKEGYYAYQKKQYKLAVLLYMEAALLGSDTGAVNAALIIDEFKVLNDYDLDGTKLEQEMLMDLIWMELSSTYNYKPPKDIQRFLHEDLFNVLSNLKYPETKTGVILQTLGQTNSEVSQRYRQQLVLKLLKLGAEELEPLSLVVLGDSYQTGKHGEKDDKKAYEQYSQIMSVIPVVNNPNILSHSLYNLGYMKHHGLGTRKNLTQAIEYYNLIKRFDKRGSYLTMMNKKLAEWEKDIYGEELPNALEGKDNMEMDEMSLIKGLFRRFEERYMKKIMLGFLILGAIILYLAKMRLENYVNLSVSEEKRK